ncbi:V-type ATP synthase subunit E [Candidatus Woesearchaeota archaeon]|nr:V-type ATP synthase subunit E [Candidatus Woesearchaeota archaeon]
MQVFGNVESLKKAIENKYSSIIKDAEKEKQKQLAEIDKELKKKLELLKSHMKTETDAEVKKTTSMILSAAKLKAKKEFEEKREAIIESVFEGAEKKARDIAHSKDYTDFVKKSMPNTKGLSVAGDSDYYSKVFPELKVDKNIIGVKFESEKLVYDFTLDSIIASKKDILRHEVSKILFS